MNNLVSAIIGDLINRSVSFLIDKYCQQQPSIDKHIELLHRVLLRIDTVVLEAEDRRIMNKGMLRQLKLLQQGMYKGHYLLDTFRYQPFQGEVSHSSSAFSKSRPLKRLRFSGGGSSRETLPFRANSIEDVQELVAALEYNLADMKEFAIILVSCPRMLRQPCSQYLLLDNCMFGRKTEGERVLNFLLQKEASPDLAVLPVVGPVRSGKTTLVEHVCKDERVRDRFSLILYFSEKRLNDEGAIYLGHNMNGLVKHQNCASRNRFLIIVEVADEIEEGTWRRLKSSTICRAPSGSKIIITSRSNKIISLGTTEALQLDYLSPEAFWYFFKMVAFQCTNPDEHPKMASIAMEIALELGQCFNSAYIFAGLLRDNFNPQFWSTTLNCLRADKQMNILMFDEHPTLLLRKDKPAYCRLAKNTRFLLICSYGQLESTEETPKLSLQEILLGNGDTLPQGRFEALAWKSRIAPYFNYTLSCIMQAPQSTMGKKKGVRPRTL